MNEKFYENMFAFGLKLAKENGATDDLTVIAVKIFSRA